MYGISSNEYINPPKVGFLRCNLVCVTDLINTFVVNIVVIMVGIFAHVHCDNLTIKIRMM